MKNYIFLVLALLGTLSCKQKSNNGLNESISIERIIQRFDELTEISYNIEQIWRGPKPGSIDSISGFCSFIQEKSDTLIGAHYLFTFNKSITQLYNGEIFIRANSENKSAEIYNLNEYSSPRRRVTSPILYLLSFDEIVNDLKEKLNHKPKNIMILKDTTIDNINRFRIKIIDQDTIINGNHNDIHSIIIFDKGTLLPLFASNIARMPGEIYKEQTIDVIFSQFKIKSTPTNKNFDLSSIPFQIQKLTYATDNQTLPVLKIKDISPQWSGTLISGDSISSKDQNGKITLLNFTAVNCGYCLKANEVLNRIDAKFKKSKLAVLSVYPIDNLDNIKYLVTKSNINHSIIYNAPKMQKDYQVTVFPYLFLINQDGKIEYVSLGFSDKLETELTETIDRLLLNK